MPLTDWLPPAPHIVDGWRITPIWRRGDHGPVCVGVTILADPDSDDRLTADVWERLHVWDVVAAGPPPQRLVRVADAYRQADSEQRPRAAAVAAALGISEASASNAIVAARKAGLLPATRPGVSAA